MPFVKGKIKTGGKKKGLPNKRTQQALLRVEFVLSLLDQTIEKDIKALEPRERAKLWIDSQEYVRPKLNRTSMDINSEDIKTTISNIFPTKEEIERVLNERKAD